MTDEPNSMLVHCGSCSHEWFAIKLPMPMREAAEKLMNLECPHCTRRSKIYCGPAPAISDDLVKRLRYAADKAKKEYPEVFCVSKEIAHEAADYIEKLEAANLKQSCIKVDDQMRIEKLEAALKNISEGDIPRTVKIPFRDDGQLSKHDRCEHGQWFYEDCGCCIEDYARKALEGKDD